MGNKKEEKNYNAFIILKVKPKYLKEFTVMMVACQALYQRNKSDSFNWDKIQKNKRCEKIRLIEFLNRHFAIDWVNTKTQVIEKNKGGEAIEVSNGNKSLLLRLDRERTKAYLEIYGIKTCELVAEKENGELNIYKPKHDELAEILECFPIFGPFDFFLKISGEYEEIIQTTMLIREKLSIYIEETCTLTSFDISEFTSNNGEELFKIIDKNKYELNDWDNVNGIDNKEFLKIYFDVYSDNPNNKDIYISQYNTYLKIEIDENNNKKPTLEVTKGKIYNLLFKKNEYLFNWDEIQGNGNDILKKFKDILNQNFAIEWGERADIMKSNDGRTINVFTGNNFLSLSLNNEKTKVYLIIDDVRTYEFIAKTENDKLNIYKDGNLGKCQKLFREYLGEETFQRLVDFKQYLDYSTINGKDGDEDQRFVFIRVKPEFTEKFFLATTLIENFCKYSKSTEFAKINNIYYIVGQFDYLIDFNKDNKNKIGRTIFRIREILGDYIRDTVTINKIDLPMTNDEIKKIFKNILEKEYILNKDGEKIPNESNLSSARFNLEEIYRAETSSLIKLLDTPISFFEYENLNKRIDEIENRLEKINRNKD